MKLFRNRIFFSIFLFLVSFAVYAPSLKSGFVWDDLMQLKSKNLKFTEEGKEFSLFPDVDPEKEKKFHFRPLLKLSWSIDNLLWGKSPFGFHLTNLILNSITVLFFYFLAFLILSEFGVKRKEGVAFVGSLFFALFPVHVEAVSWISARGDLLSTSFLFLGLIFHILSYKYIGYRKIAIFLLGVLSFYLALASKEIAVAFPLIVILFDLLHRRIATRGSILRNSVYLLVLLLYLYLRSGRFIVEPIIDSRIVEGSASNNLQVWDILETLFQTYFFYFKKLVFPYNLNPYIHILPAGITTLLSSILIILIMVAIGFMSFLKKENITAFGIFWILINLGPPSLIAVVSIGQTPVAERFMYLTSAGFCILIAYLLIEYAGRIRKEKFGWALSIIILASYLVFTIQGQNIWKSHLDMWRYAANKSGDHAVPHAMYGITLRRIGNNLAAMREFLKAWNTDGKGIPNTSGRALAAHNLGLIEVDQGNLKAAENWFSKALEIEPERYKSKYYHNMGYIHYIKAELKFNNNEDADSQYKTAMNFFKEALAESKKPAADDYLLLGVVYWRLGDFVNAREYTERAVQLGLPRKLGEKAQLILNSAK